MTDKKPTNDGRDTKGRFTAGNRLSKGKPKGTRHKATQAALTLMEGQLEQITQKLVDAAVDGDMTAIRLVFDKLLPSTKEVPIPSIDLPRVHSSQDLPLFTNAVLEAVTNGNLLPSHAQSIFNIVSFHLKALELSTSEKKVLIDRPAPSPYAVENYRRALAGEFAGE